MPGLTRATRPELGGGVGVEVAVAAAGQRRTARARRRRTGAGPARPGRRAAARRRQGRARRPVAGLGSHRHRSPGPAAGRTAAAAIRSPLPHGLSWPHRWVGTGDDGAVGVRDSRLGRRRYLRASTADRERAVDVLKAGFAEGRLTKDEYDGRAGRRSPRARSATWRRSRPTCPAGIAGPAALAGGARAQDQPARDRLAGVRPWPAVHRHAEHDPGRRARPHGPPRDPPHR